MTTSACGTKLEVAGDNSLSSLDSQNGDSSGSGDTGTSVGNSFKPQICSDLPFDYISWPKGTNQQTADLFALALNITGSFEGHDGWSNISNNFDGQGLSLGLFNQNLGSGSLQPLMINYFTNHSSRILTHFTPSQKSSIESMLSAWNDGPLSGGLSKAKSQSLDVFNRRTTDLDDPSLVEDEDMSTNDVLQKSTASKTQESVSWAVANLYNGSSFKADWKTNLQSFADDPAYISLQVQAAKYIHNRAVGYMNKYGFKETRAYLFFFDIVVQNGSLTSGVESKYEAWAKSNTSASEITKLNKILEYRLQIVRTEYVNDVRLRKTAVINSTGTVHGSKRDFRKEYCGPSWSLLYTSRVTLN